MDINLKLEIKQIKQWTFFPAYHTSVIPSIENSRRVKLGDRTGGFFVGNRGDRWPSWLARESLGDFLDSMFILWKTNRFIIFGYLPLMWKHYRGESNTKNICTCSVAQACVKFMYIISDLLPRDNFGDFFPTHSSLNSMSLESEQLQLSAYEIMGFTHTSSEKTNTETVIWMKSKTKASQSLVGPQA